MAADFYKRLGVDSTATSSEMRTAFRSRARKLHPDRYVSADPQTQEDAEKSMRALNEAWAVLGDVEKRREYDQRSSWERQPVRPAQTYVARDEGWVSHDMGATVSLRLLAWRILLAFAGLGLTWALFLVVLSQFVDDDQDQIAAVLGEEAPVVTPETCVRLTVTDLILTVDCAEPNLGRPIQVVDDLRACTNPNSLRVKIPDGSARWLCVLPLDAQE